MCDCHKAISDWLIVEQTAISDWLIVEYTAISDWLIVEHTAISKWVIVELYENAVSMKQLVNKQALPSARTVAAADAEEVMERV
mgnify:CR=1 FL=1